MGNPLLPSHVTGCLQVKTLAICRKHYTGHFHLDLLTHVYFSLSAGRIALHLANAQAIGFSTGRPRPLTALVVETQDM